MLFPQADPALLNPYLQHEYPVAPVPTVGASAKVRSLPILYAAQQHFILWLAERSVAGFCGIAFPLPPLSINILIVGGCFSRACLQSSQLILFLSCFFIPLLQ